MAALPRSELDGAHTVKELQAKGVALVHLSAPPGGEVPLADARFRVTRKVRVVSAEPLRVELIEDVIETKTGEAICRRPPLDEMEVEDGLDPCDPGARIKRVKIFLRMNKVWLGTGAGLVLVMGAAWMVRRRKKRTG